MSVAPFSSPPRGHYKPWFGSGAAALALLLVTLMPAEAKGVFEWRVFEIGTAQNAEAFDKGMAAAKPMWREAGATAVGVFRPKNPDGENPHFRYVLSVYPSAEAFAAAAAARVPDAASATGDPFWYGDAETCPYDRVAVSLLVPFDGFPALVEPEGEAGDGRFFELRTYESPSAGKGALKVEMFNKAECDIFVEVGLRGVFFGEAVAAPNAPQLTYMLVYDDEAEKKRAWDAFRTAPSWLALKDDPRYAGTVSNIHSTELVAVPYSDVR